MELANCTWSSGEHSITFNDTCFGFAVDGTPASTTWVAIIAGDKGIDLQSVYVDSDGKEHVLWEYICATVNLDMKFWADPEHTLVNQLLEGLNDVDA